MSHTQPSTFQPAALQVFKLFWRSVSNFVHVYTEAPNPASSSTTPSLDNNNYQKNYCMRVMREVSNYLRIKCIVTRTHFVCDEILLISDVGRRRAVAHRKRRLEEKEPLIKLPGRFDN
jgi:hypothetical protein